MGIGPGSACITRKKAGVGYTHLSAIIEWTDATHGLRGHMYCADGGCVVPGDVVKSFEGGADFVMLGGMFTVYYECAGEVFIENDIKLQAFLLDVLNRDEKV